LRLEEYPHSSSIPPYAPALLKQLPKLLDRIERSIPTSGLEWVRAIERVLSEFEGLAEIAASAAEGRILPDRSRAGRPPEAGLP
jgi:hypothetical protein